MPRRRVGSFFSFRFDGAPRRLRSRIEFVAGAMRDAAFNKSSHCFRAILCFVIPVCSSFRVACMNFFRGRLGVSLADRAGSKHTCFAADLFSTRPPFAESRLWRCCTQMAGRSGRAHG